MAADVVLTDASHAGKQAICLGKPLIAVNMTSEPFPYNRYDEDSVAILCQSTELLFTEIGRFLDDPSSARERRSGDRQAYIRRHMTANDGRASERIAKILIDPGARAVRSQG